MAKKKKKAAKKESAPETPADEEPEDDAEPETADPFAENTEPETPGPFGEGAEGEGESEEPGEEKAEEEAPAGPADAPTVTFAEKHAQKRGEKPVKGDPEKWGIVDFISKVNYTAGDIESVDYYEMAGVSVLTMSDGKKFDVTD